MSLADELLADLEELGDELGDQENDQVAKTNNLEPESAFIGLLMGVKQEKNSEP